MPNLQKQNHSGGEINHSNARRALPLSSNTDISNSNKRHSLTNMEQRPHSFNATRRSSLTGLFLFFICHSIDHVCLLMVVFLFT
jgi:hypothetical protein